MLDLVLLGGLALFLFHALIFKIYIGDAPALAGWLVAAFVLIVVNREVARGVHPAARSRLMSAWAGLDGVGLLYVAFFFLLLLIFDGSYLRATADGREYFAQVRSLVIDHDLDFANENAMFRTGGMPEIFPFGSAAMWLPFFLAAHGWLGILNLFGGEHARNGFANPYQMAIGLGTLAYGFAGLLMIQRIAADYFGRRIAALATVFLTSGSFLVWYLAIEGSYTHGNSLFATTLFLFIWYRTRERRTARQWGWLGLAAGLMCMVRWQNAVFLVFPLVDGALTVVGTLRRRSGGTAARGSRIEAPAARRTDAGDSSGPGTAGDSSGPGTAGDSSGPGTEGDSGGQGTEGAAPATLRGAAVAGLSFAGAFLAGAFPQLAFWRVVNGGWLALPHGQSGQQWWGDSLWVDVLFSSNHGLLAWSPVIFFALLGVPLFLLRDFRFGSLLTLVFGVQVYVNGAVATWWGGHAIGGRRFASCALLFALGLAALITWAQKRPLAAVATILIVLTAVNAFFIADIRAGALPTSEGIAFDRMLGAAYARVGNPFSFPASWLFARRYGMSVRQYDQLGLRMYNNLALDIGAGADERFLGRGWSGAESNAGGSYRWALGPESIVIAPLKAPTFVDPGEELEQADYVVLLRGEPFLFEGAPRQSVELWVNGGLAGRRPLSAEMRDYRIDVPRELLVRNLNEIRLRYAYWRSPAELGASEDARPLAVRFERIELRRQ